MRIPPSFYNATGRILLFILLEAFCLFLVAKNGIIERFLLNTKAEHLRSFLLEKSEGVKNYFNLASVNADMAIQNAQLLSENARLGKIIEQYEGDSLLKREIPGSRDSLSGAMFEYDWAKVVKNRLNGGHNYLVINKGTDDGITEDMGVVTTCGVVGIIRSAGRRYSIVLSFLNPTQNISAKLGHNNAYGILSWDGKSLHSATLSDIQQHIPVNAGDTVYTGGHSALFPPDIPVGVIREAGFSGGMHKSAKVELFQDYTLLDYVYIVKNREKAVIDSLSLLPATNYTDYKGEASR